MFRIRFLFSGRSLVLGLQSTFMWLAIFLAGNLLGQPCAADDADVRKSVVKIKVTRVSPDLYEPWKRKSPRESGGTGVIIDGNRILTNAHVVGYARSITVQGFESAEKVTAKVIGISKGQDLAVLSVDDEEFFEDRPALQFLDKLPAVKDKVNVFGFPYGGRQISVTEGIISRIEFGRYLKGITQGLRIQIDAAVNPGNSGGPAVKDGKMVGLVFSGIREADNVAYLIPIEEIRLFLNDIKDGSYDGKLVLPRCYSTQTLENDAIRKKLGLSKKMGGVMVREIKAREGNQDDDTLRTWDVITKIDGQAIDRQGMTALGEGSRVSLYYLIQKHIDEDTVHMTLLRDGKEVEVDVRLRRGDLMLAKDLKLEYPKYIIVGPMVFQPATTDFVYQMHGSKKWVSHFVSKLNPVMSLGYSPRTVENEDVEVVLTGLSFLPHAITKGYSDPGFGVIKKFNDVEVKNLKHMVELMRDSKEEYFVFEFAGKSYETYVFEREAFLAATEEVLDDNGIRRQGTPELLKVWNQEPAE